MKLVNAVNMLFDNNKGKRKYLATYTLFFFLSVSLVMKSFTFNPSP